MEKYRFILLDTFGANQHHVCQYLPENIQGLKLTKKMSMAVPIGWSVEASTDTIRLVKGDADILRRLFFSQGINMRQKVELGYLNKMATGYDTLFTAWIDPETVEGTASYIEFGLFLNEKQREWKDKSKLEVNIYSKGSTIAFPQMRLYNLIDATGVGRVIMGGLGLNAFSDKNSRVFDNKVIAFHEIPNSMVQHRFPFFSLITTNSTPKRIDLNIVFNARAVHFTANQRPVLFLRRADFQIDANGNYTRIGQDTNVELGTFADFETKRINITVDVFDNNTRFKISSEDFFV